MSEGKEKVDSFYAYELPPVSWGTMHEREYQKIFKEEGEKAALEFAKKYGWDETTINKRNSCF